jgi:hypothetical protein
MSGLLTLLTVKKNELKTGTVLKQTKNGISVKIGNQISVMKNTTQEVLPLGSRVVIGNAAGQKYILGRESLSSSTIQKVVVNG